MDGDELYQPDYTHTADESNTTKDESNIHNEDNTWQILYPEISQNFNISPLNNPSIPPSFSINDQHENIQEHDKQHSSDSSSSSSSSSNNDQDSEDTQIINTQQINESPNNHKKNPSILSDISEDLILTEHESLTDQPRTSSVNKSILSQPPLQEMHKDDPSFNPRRIPSAVFDRSDSLIPAEWSEASNESLFSINVGNASIGRDQAIRLMAKSTRDRDDEGLFVGDLQEIRDFAGFLKLSDDQGIDIIGTDSKLSIPEVGDEKEGDYEEKLVKKKVMVVIKEGDDVMEIVSEMKLQGVEQQNNRQQNMDSSSEDSNYSFAFPIFGADVEKNNGLVKGSSPPQIPYQKLHESETFVQSHHSKGFFSCFRCFSCYSCCHFHLCCSCSSCFSFSSCTHCPSCFSCTSCTPCSSCKSCFSCKSCKNCFNCC